MEKEKIEICFKNGDDMPAREQLFKEILDVQGKSVNGEYGLANCLDEIEEIADNWRVFITNFTT